MMQHRRLVLAVIAAGAALAFAAGSATASRSLSLEPGNQ
jgi:hypothetical protein